MAVLQHNWCGTAAISDGVSRESVASQMSKAGCLILWALVVFLPVAVLLGQMVLPAAEYKIGGHIMSCLFRSFVLATVVSTAAVLLGWVCGCLLGTSTANRDIILLLLLLPLVLPQYVLYYAWSLLLSPTTSLGRYLAGNTDLASYAGVFTSLSVLVLWYWPLAALVIAQGWRNVPKGIQDCASLDVSGFRLFRYVTLPLLKRSILLAFGVCFVLSLSEFATFHLAGVQTIGTELAVLYELTGSDSFVIKAAWPAVVAALVVAVVLGKNAPSWILSGPAIEPVRFQSNKWRWAVLLILIGVSSAAPVAVLIYNVAGTQAFKEFLTLHLDELGWSAAIAAVSAVMAYLVARGALLLEKSPAPIERWHGHSFDCADDKIGRVFTGWKPVIRLKAVPGWKPVPLLAFVVRSTIFLTMFVPASLVAVCVLRILTVCGVPAQVRQSWFVVSAGQASRFAGVALIMLLMTRYPYEKCLSEMASLDGASRLGTWWYVHFPHTWPIFVGTFILVTMFSVTELAATMVLLPAGLPNFAQRLLNQMHYARDQQVIASCLVLICLFMVLAGTVVLLVRLIQRRQQIIIMICAGILCLMGCDERIGKGGEPKVLWMFGRTGSGPGEFIYPRAIEIVPTRLLVEDKSGGSLFIVDKTGRIQQMTPEGNCLTVIRMPKIEAGKPTGLTIRADGRLYVADTHYHRVVIFSLEGKIVGEFGKFGQEGGCFIYPTDVAFSEDGRIYVSEYGGNDRVSVFDEKWNFLYSFGSPGNGAGQFSRPSAICVDVSRKRLYVADACNHRIGIYSLDGQLLGYIGSAGRAAGQLRYPYDLALLPDGTVVVCEFGNNRIQLFSPEGESLAAYGRAGRQTGELAYPWGVAVDRRRRAFIVDAGNNRVQVWQL